MWLRKEEYREGNRGIRQSAAIEFFGRKGTDRWMHSVLNVHHVNRMSSCHEPFEHRLAVVIFRSSGGQDSSRKLIRISNQIHLECTPAVKQVRMV